jgi:hypothetical protein
MSTWFKKSGEMGVVHITMGLITAGLIAGCAMPNGYYQPATISAGVISNPTVGWTGYAVKVSEGFTIFNPAMVEAASADLTDFQRFYMQDEDRFSRALGVAYSEWFLLEHRLLDCFISFACCTYELPSAWSTLTSVDTEYLLRKLINQKRVDLDDADAQNELVSINGHRGWHISATTRSPFGGVDEPLAYEGYFIIGDLKEAYWFEGFGALYNRSLLERLTRGMAENLEIK